MLHLDYFKLKFFEIDWENYSSLPVLL